MVTLEAYRREGTPRRRLEQGLKRAGEVLDRLPALGIDPAEVVEQLEREGVQKFITPYDKLLATLERRRVTVAG
jgi:transaldolase